MERLEGEVVDIDDFKKEYKRRKIKEKFTSACNSVKAFYRNNEELCNKVLIPGTLALTIYGVKYVGKANNLRKQKYLKERFVYDQKMKRHCEFKRKPTRKEWRIITARRQAGECYSSILDDMGLIKY